MLPCADYVKARQFQPCALRNLKHPMILFYGGELKGILKVILKNCLKLLLLVWLFCHLYSKNLVSRYGILCSDRTMNVLSEVAR